MSELPDGWPAESPVETLPTIWLALPDASWPPATADRPAGVAPVGAWSLERELVGSMLPGNVRARSGLSIGAASAEISQVPGAPLAPWSRDASKRVVPRARAELYATHDGHDAEARIDLGDWMVDPASGGLLAPGVEVELIEAQYAGRRQDQLLPTAFEAVDPAWIVATMARQCGYHATPPPVASAVVAAPMSGGTAAEVGELSGVLPIEAWDRSTGPLSPVGDVVVIYSWPTESVLQVSGRSVFVTLNIVGSVDLRWGYQYNSPGCTVRVDDTGALQVRNGAVVDSMSPAGTFVPGDSLVHPKRVQLEVQRLYATPGDTESSTGVRARARSSEESAWSAWVTDSTASTRDVSVYLAVLTAAGSSWSSMQMTRETDPALWVPVTADIDPIGGQMDGPWLPATMDPWDAIQQACSAHLAACWVTRERMMVCRNREYLAGAGVTATPIDVGASVEDLSWTIDPADTADRLELTYSPSDISETNYSTTPWTGIDAWASPDVLELPPGQTVEVVADLDFFINLLGPRTWGPAWDPSENYVAAYPVYSALPNRDGTGTQPADTAVTVTHREVSVGRVVISIRNNSSTTLYTVDRNGQPCLILRGYRKIGRDVSATVVRGADETVASNVLTIDASTWVQRAVDAEAIAAYIWARVSQPAWKASGVKVRLDWMRDIGDIVILGHARSGLLAKAMITKVELDGSAGEISQTLDLVLLPPTWDDFDAEWAGATWDDFDSEWSGSTWANFDADPTKRSD